MPEPVLRVRRRQVVGPAEGAHLAGLMSTKGEIRTRLARARQHESCLAILGEVADRIRLVHLAAVHQASRAGETAPLVTECGKVNSRLVGCVPDVLVG